ncbi:hypothetical protein CR513_59703, partial [Mucuna pruriens]
YSNIIYVDSNSHLYKCFPSHNPIVVPKQTIIPYCRDEYNQLAINNVSQHIQIVVSNNIGPIKLQDAQIHRSGFVYTRTYVKLKTLDPYKHKSMREVAKITFKLLNTLGVDYKLLSDHVLNYINVISPIVEIN